MKKNKGFSLVELIVVIAIMAILAAVAVVGFSVYVKHAQEGSDEDYIANVLHRVQLFSMEYGVEVYGVVIPPVVDDQDDILLIIGKDASNNPIYLDPEADSPAPKHTVYEIYETVGNYEMQSDRYKSESYTQFFPGAGGGAGDPSDPSDPSDPNNPSDPDNPINPGDNPIDHEHIFLNEVEGSRVPGNCCSKGSVTYRCSSADCTATETRELPYGDHPGEDTAKAESGFKVWKCPACKQIIIRSVSGSAVVPIK